MRVAKFFALRAHNSTLTMKILTYCDCEYSREKEREKGVSRREGYSSIVFQDSLDYRCWHSLAVARERCILHRFAGRRYFARKSYLRVPCKRNHFSLGSPDSYSFISFLYFIIIFFCNLSWTRRAQTDKRIKALMC